MNSPAAFCRNPAKPLRAALAGAAWLVGVACLAAAPAGPAFAADASDQAADQPGDPWPALARQIFGDRPIEDGSGLVAIDAPYRAEDAAVVPIVLRTTLPPSDARQVRRLTLVIDQNPSPLAATIELGPHDAVDHFATNVRVDAYTFMHVVAELSDGKLYAVKRFVKAAGGCSAPAQKAAGAIPLGTLRFRQFAAASPGSPPEAQIMIRHPNNSGMQMDQMTHLYIPADFVETLRVWHGDELLFSVAGGISIAENPQFRFDYRANGDTGFHADVKDSTGRAFEGKWPGGQS